MQEKLDNVKIIDSQKWMGVLFITLLPLSLLIFILIMIMFLFPIYQSDMSNIIIIFMIIFFFLGLWVWLSAYNFYPGYMKPQIFILTNEKIMFRVYPNFFFQVYWTELNKIEVIRGRFDFKLSPDFAYQIKFIGKEKIKSFILIYGRFKAQKSKQILTKLKEYSKQKSIPFFEINEPMIFNSNKEWWEFFGSCNEYQSNSSIDDFESSLLTKIRCYNCNMLFPFDADFCPFCNEEVKKY